MTNNKLIEHHVKYKELHGYDETVWMTRSEHRKLHHRLRKEGECNVPVDELHRIAMAAHGRTKKKKEWKSKYMKEYSKRHIQSFDFFEYTGPNTRLHEIIGYNHKTGTVSYSSRFRGTHKNKLLAINI